MVSHLWCRTRCGSAAISRVSCIRWLWCWREKLAPTCDGQAVPEGQVFDRQVVEVRHAQGDQRAAIYNTIIDYRYLLFSCQECAHHIGWCGMPGTCAWHDRTIDHQNGQVCKLKQCKLQCQACTCCLLRHVISTALVVQSSKLYPGTPSGCKSVESMLTSKLSDPACEQLCAARTTQMLASPRLLLRHSHTG